MDIRSVDLNLLVVFNAMLEHRNVTKAGEALRLSQPAMSAAVSRLRGLFDDPLFVRSGAEMVPTPKAQMLSPSVRQVVRTIEVDILRPTSFDPASSSRSFTLVTPDIAEVNFLPRLLTELAQHAPHINLKTLAMPRQAAAQALESGMAEMAIGYFPDLHKAGFFQQKLISSAHVCLVRKDHPQVGNKLTLAQFNQGLHAVVKPDGREHVFEQFLQSKGIERRVVAGQVEAQLVQRIDLGVLPGRFLLLAPVLAGLADRTRLAAAAHLAAFLVLHALLEAALGHVLVDLGAAHLAAGVDHVHGGFLAALERSQHFIDDAVVDQRLQAQWGSH